MEPRPLPPVATPPPTLILAGALAMAPMGLSATVIETFITGETGTGLDVIFRAVLDPAVAGSATVGVAVTETRALRLDGIEFEAGSTDIVVVGAQKPGTPSDGAITRYDVRTGAILPDVIASTNAIAPAPVASLPSTIFPTPAGVYYVENQFGFASSGGPPTAHRIIFKPSGGGPEMVVFDGADCTPALGDECVNFEGIELTPGGTLLTFVRDPDDADKRALITIPLDGGTGLWDGTAIVKEIGGLSAAAGIGDGSDELDIDASTGIVYGTNIVSGELIQLVGGVTSVFIDPLVIAASTGNLNLLDSRVDGVRADGAGHLVLASTLGLLLSVDIAGVLADGADDSDVLVLYDSTAAGTGYRFDDLTSLNPVPLPSPLWLMLAAIWPLCRTRVKRLGKNW